MKSPTSYDFCRSILLNMIHRKRSHTISSRHGTALDVLLSNRLDDEKKFRPRKGRVLSTQQRRYVVVQTLMKAAIALLMSMLFHEMLWMSPPWRHSKYKTFSGALLSKVYWSFDPNMYSSPFEQKQRFVRFPSVEERVKLYMSNWYVPPCSANEKVEFTVDVVPEAGQWLEPMVAGASRVETSLEEASATDSVETLESLDPQQMVFKELPGMEPLRKGVYVVQDEITMAQIIAIRPEKAHLCGSNEYCPDTLDYIIPAVRHHNEAVESGTVPAPILAQFGDSSIVRGYNKVTGEWDRFPNVPLIMKFRYAFHEAEAISAMTSGDCISGERPIHKAADKVARSGGHYQPIVWKLTSLRHFAMIPDIPTYDIPFEQKKDVAVFRGALTGVFRDGYKHHMRGKISDLEKCQLIHRCRLVYNTDHSHLVNAKLVQAKKQDAQNNEIPDQIGNIKIFGAKYNYPQMLEHKAIIMLEGNDISSGFKWALYSNSVVMTQPPTKTSWAMEELLEPWVHYIPLNENLTDVEEKMQWIVDNPGPAKKIAKAGSLWIRDLLFHPDSSRDDDSIYAEMIRRYRLHFTFKVSF